VVVEWWLSGGGVRAEEDDALWRVQAVGACSLVGLHVPLWPSMCAVSFDDARQTLPGLGTFNHSMHTQT
jgi:hypothetical protein